MIDIFNSPGKEQFRIHKELLCSRVPYFEKMFRDGGFIESVDQTASFPEDDPAIFSLFLEWLYTKNLAPINVANSTETSGPLVDLMRLYQFADKLCLLELADYAITILVSNYDHHHLPPSQFAMKLAYEITGAGSGLRAFMVNFLFFRVEQNKWGTKELCE